MSASISISISMDRKAALAAGRVVGERESILVTQDGLGDHWTAMVADLDMSSNPPKLKVGYFDDPSESAVVTYYQHQAEERAAKQSKFATELAQYAAALDAYESALSNPLTPTPCYAYDDLTRWAVGSWNKGWQFDGWTRSMPDVQQSRPCEYPVPPELDALDTRRDGLLRRNEDQIRIANQAAFKAALPEMRERKAAAEAEAARKAAEAADAQKAADAAKFAQRLESGYWERETGSYNERRYSAPWCASVSFSSGPKPVYTWGESTGKWGKSGLLRVACKPGEFVAWGQKDLRRPDRSEHNILRMRPDGSMESFDNATEAYKVWRESQKPAAATV